MFSYDKMSKASTPFRMLVFLIVLKDKSLQYCLKFEIIPNIYVTAY